MTNVLKSRLRAIGEFTWQLRYNPNCPSTYEVRMVGRRRGKIWNDVRDIIGYGKTLETAIKRALEKHSEEHA